jgi:hypothetical protein
VTADVVRTFIAVEEVGAGSHRQCVPDPAHIDRVHPRITLSSQDPDWAPLIEPNCHRAEAEDAVDPINHNAAPSGGIVDTVPITQPRSRALIPSPWDSGCRRYAPPAIWFVAVVNQPFATAPRIAAIMVVPAALDSRATQILHTGYSPCQSDC